MTWSHTKMTGIPEKTKRRKMIKKQTKQKAWKTKPGTKPLAKTTTIVPDKEINTHIRKYVRKVRKSSGRNHDRFVHLRKERKVYKKMPSTKKIDQILSTHPRKLPKKTKYRMVRKGTIRSYY